MPAFIHSFWEGAEIASTSGVRKVQHKCFRNPDFSLAYGRAGSVSSSRTGRDPSMNSFLVWEAACRGSWELAPDAAGRAQRQQPSWIRSQSVCVCVYNYIHVLIIEPDDSNTCCCCSWEHRKFGPHQLPQKYVMAVITLVCKQGTLSPLGKPTSLIITSV